MAADGRTNREIAEELWITLKTVETHLGRPTASSASAGAATWPALAADVRG